MPDVVVVDHHDSYTWNLVHLLASVTGVLPTVVQHDDSSAAYLLGFSHVVLSPGPGTPTDKGDFAVGREVLLDGSVPVLGVCLGMQGLVATYGGVVDRVAPAHGDLTLVTHDGRGVFAGVPQEFKAVRYHSLAALSVPDTLVVTRTRRRRHGDGGAAPLAPAGGRAVPSRVDPQRARRAARRQLPRTRPWMSAVMTSSRSSPRSRPSIRAASGSTVAVPGSGRGAVRWSAGSTTTTSRSPSTPARARYAVTPPAASRWSARTCSRCSRPSSPQVPPDDQWFGYFGYAARPDLFPARPDPDLPDAVWMRCRNVRFFDHGPLGTSSESSLLRPRFV